MKDRWWFVPHMPDRLRNLAYRVPYRWTRWTRSKPSERLPVWAQDLWVVWTQRWFIPYRGGDPRMTSYTKAAMAQAIKEHRLKLENDPVYRQEHEDRWKVIREGALPIIDHTKENDL